MDITKAVKQMLQQGEFEPCKKCKMDAVCAEKKLYCMNAILAKINDRNDWSPPWRD